jgi:signal transduction histidine kinase
LINKALHEAKTANDPADRNIEVTFGDVPLVDVDPQQIAGAMSEVIGNAIQATDEKEGQIDIHAAFDPYSNRVAIVVQDNGSGMDEPTQKRAFDPFFSAKPAGRRRGMGLAKALRWVEASGGSIRLESRLGQGTRILILLPAVKSDVIDPPAAQRKQA